MIRKGFYYNDVVTPRLLMNLTQDSKSGIRLLKEKEIEFIRLACSDMTYKEIADTMILSPKTIDGYREDVFQKLECKEPRARPGDLRY